MSTVGLLKYFIDFSTTNMIISKKERSNMLKKVGMDIYTELSVCLCVCEKGERKEKKGKERGRIYKE